MKIILVLIGFIGFSLAAQELPSPSQFLGEEYGKQFTAHHRLVDYFQEMSKDPRVSLQQYGTTYEGRPLYMAIVTSEANHENLEAIREKNLALAQMGSSNRSDDEALPIVWLSYSVHGNEAGGSESSMNVIYELLTNPEQSNVLDDVVVIIDPSLNPDGYSRYTHWLRGSSGKALHPEHTDIEHMEPWPGGRVNHYLFDLNRDWAWQTQKETRQRIVQYNRWMPHVHADLHEMGYDSHYYFAPAAEPYHKAITDYQRELQTKIGKSHAAIFDQNSWLYFTREVFDLLYPSYGDTYPTFNGSVGMTYEQAGHGMAGRAITMSNKKQLTLQDRIDHHTATSLSTIRTAVIESSSILSNFKAYFEQSASPVGKPYKGYIVKQGASLSSFKELLANNGIQYGIIDVNKKANGYSYFQGDDMSFEVQKGDVFIPTDQAKSVLLEVLMEEEPVLADSVTYDITSWSLPFAYGLESYGVKSIYSNQADDHQNKVISDVENDAYAIYVKWSSSLESKSLTASLLKEDLTIKSVRSTIHLDGITLEPGDVVIIKGDQLSLSHYDLAIRLLQKTKVECGRIESGYSLNGKDLGGSALQKIHSPKVLTFFGEGVNANAYGQVWYYFEQILDYPISRVDIQQLSSIDLSIFNTIILPDGYYSLSEHQRKELGKWIREGGKLISVGGANRNLKIDEQFAISEIEQENNKEVEEKADKERYKKRQYEGAERRSIAGSIPGAIIKTEIDPTHPLCYGLESYYTLKNSRTKYPLMGKGVYNPVRIPRDYISYGFIGSEIQEGFEENAVFSVQRMGRGQVVYMLDNPLFRSFWKNGEVVFANALFQL